MLENVILKKTLQQLEQTQVILGYFEVKLRIQKSMISIITKNQVILIYNNRLSNG